MSTTKDTLLDDLRNPPLTQIEDLASRLQSTAGQAPGDTRTVLPKFFDTALKDRDATRQVTSDIAIPNHETLSPRIADINTRRARLAGIADLIEDAVRQAFPHTDLPLDHNARNAALNILISRPDVDQVVDQPSQRDRTYYHPHPGMATATTTSRCY